MTNSSLVDNNNNDSIPQPICWLHKNQKLKCLTSRLSNENSGKFSLLLSIWRIACSISIFIPKNMPNFRLCIGVYYYYYHQYDNVFAISERSTWEKWSIVNCAYACCIHLLICKFVDKLSLPQRTHSDIYTYTDMIQM